MCCVALSVRLIEKSARAIADKIAEYGLQSEFISSRRDWQPLPYSATDRSFPSRNVSKYLKSVPAIVMKSALTCDRSDG
ncbi:hypothetical protein CKA32_002653 [Geitlerinema sp. FC II]|nr:hypothetical protein CKA32_002653 [Geitlerinema sp. FC II]